MKIPHDILILFIDDSFKHSYVLSWKVKSLAWAMVILLNLFFVYFSMLRALEKDMHWQRLYAFLCVVQFLVEVFLYETSECIIMHFSIPDLVRSDVQAGRCHSNRSCF